MYKNGIFEIDYIDFFSSFFWIIIVQTNQLIHQKFWLITFSFIIEVISSRHFHLMVFFHNFFNYFQLWKQLLHTCTGFTERVYIILKLQTLRTFYDNMWFPQWFHSNLIFRNVLKLWNSEINVSFMYFVFLLLILMLLKVLKDMITSLVTILEKLR